MHRNPDGPRRAATQLLGRSAPVTNLSYSAFLPFQKRSHHQTVGSNKRLERPVMCFATLWKGMPGGSENAPRQWSADLRSPRKSALK